jgi:signal transduction histidine kinase
MPRGRFTGRIWPPVVFVGSLLTVIVLSNLWVYGRIGNALDDDLGRRLESIAGILVHSNILNGDNLYSDEGGFDSSELMFIDIILQRLQARNDLDAILLLDPADYLVRYSSSSDLYEINQPYPHLATHREAILEAMVEGETAASPTIQVGGRGGIYLKSGFTSVHSLLGDGPVAILVVEASPDFFDVLGTVRGAMYSGTTLAALLLLLLMAAYLGLQRQIRHAQGALERENRMAALGRLASQVAHEIRNPVSIIKYSAERMGKWLESQHGGRRTLDPELKEMITYVEEETARLHTLTERYLAYTRHGEMQLSEVIPDALIESAATALGRMGLPEGITIDVNLDEDLPAFEGDPDLLRQALLNLGTNAAEATGAGGHITLFARQSRDEAGGYFLLLGTEDNGPGIPERERNRVFDALYSTRDNGTGLGLYMVDQIARAHGGRARIETSERGGALVLLELPLGAPAESS